MALAISAASTACAAPVAAGLFSPDRWSGRGAGEARAITRPVVDSEIHIETPKVFDRFPH